MKLNTFRNDLQKLIYNATAIANLADNAAASPLTNLFVALHTAWPGLAGDQTTNEVSYTGYARVSVARTSGGWTVTGLAVSPVAAVTFGQMTAGTGGLVTHATVGAVTSGASKVFDCFVLGTRLGAFSGKVSGNTITIPQLSGLAVNDRVVMHSVDGSSLPGGVTEGTSYFVISVSTDDITVSTTQGGASITISSAGDGIIYRSTPITIVNGVTPQLTTGMTAYIE
jgi:hypothetical protein